MPIELLVQARVNGFALALVYILVALGLTLIFSILEIINFAHGEFYMLGGYATYFGFALFGLPYFPTLLLAIVVVGLAGVVAERMIFRHLRGKTLNAFIVSLGLLWVLQSAAQLSFGVLDKSVPSAFSGIIRAGGIIISVERFVVVLAALTSRPYDTVWGKLVIGAKETYGIDRQFLYPVVISEIRGGKTVDIEQVLPAALKALKK